MRPVLERFGDFSCLLMNQEPRTMNQEPLCILHLVRSLNIGGLERVVIDLANGLTQKGVECHVGCLVEPGEWIGRVKAGGIWTGSVNSRAKIAVVRDLCRYIRRNGITLIHSHNAQAHIFGVAASILTGIPLIHTKHGRNFPDIPRWVWLSRQLSRFTKRIIAVSDGVRQIAVDIERVPASKVSVIVNGVDTERFRPSGERGKGQEERGKGKNGKEETANVECRISNVECPNRETKERTTDNRPRTTAAFAEGRMKHKATAARDDSHLRRGPDEAQGYGGQGRQAGASGGNYDRRPAEVEAAYTDKAVPNLLGVKYPEATGKAFASSREPAEIEAFQSSLAPGTFVVGTVGRIVPEKNYPLLVRAFAAFHSRAPQSHLLIVGDGPNAADVEKTIAALQIGDACTIAGMQEDILPWFRIMDVFCLSSWTEGTSITLLEACACGLPAVVTDVGSNGQIVEDKVTGLVVPPEDEKTLAQALENLYRNDDTKHILGIAARKRIEERYSVTNMVREYILIYSEYVS